MLACSGLGAADAMATASLVGLVCLIVSFAATIGSVVQQRRIRQARYVAIAAVVLLLLHPTIWLGVRSGDCGNTLLLAGPMTAVLHLGLLGFFLTRKPT